MNTKMEPAPETTVEVPVTWNCDSYDGWTAGKYTFTASLDSNFVYESELPSITVTVEESKINIDSQYIITTETKDPQTVLRRKGGWSGRADPGRNLPKGLQG